MFQKRGRATDYSNLLERHKILLAVATLMGTIIGAGILGIPYVIAQAGFFYGLFLIAGIGIAFVYLNLCLGEIVLRTKKQFQLTGYAGKYLGPTGKKLMTLSVFITLYGALSAYTIGEGATLQAIFQKGTPLLYSLLFLAVTFIIIYQGIKATGKTELLLITLLIFIVITMGFYSFDQIEPKNFYNFNPTYLFLPYGVVLFSFLASPAIPELQEVLGKNKRLMKKSIIIGSLTPILIYLIFTFIVVGIVGPANFSLLEPNQHIATIALSIYSSPTLGLFANILAILAMFTSFLTLGIALLEVYHFDYKLNRTTALLLTFIVPLIILILNLTSFITLLGITGVFAGGLEGILIVAMYWKAKKQGTQRPAYSMQPHKIVGMLFIFMFSFGILYYLWDLLF